MSEFSPVRSAPIPIDGTVVIIGAGLAGLRATQGLRDGGFTGSIDLVGSELHYPYDRPPLSKQVLAGAWPPERAVLADHDRIRELGARAVLGERAVSLDAEAHRVTLDSGAVLEGDGVMIATGAHPRSLPGTEGMDHVGVLRTLEDAARIRARVEEIGPGCRVVIIGAGFIGSEVAATCSGLGSHVTVVEALPTPLAPALGEIIGGACGSLHGKNGVELLTGAGVSAVHETVDGSLSSGAPVEVSLDDGRVLGADVVVVGIGVIPTVDWLEGSALEVENGVVCDHALFAADGVVVAGDIARWTWKRHGRTDQVRIEHWEVASQMGGAAARNLVAGSESAIPFSPIPYFWSDQYGLRIQMLGRPERDDDVVVVDGALDADDGKFVAIYGQKGRFNAVIALSRPRQLMAYRPLLEAGAGFDEALTVLSQA